jgi:hypothetical protein
VWEALDIIVISDDGLSVRFPGGKFRCYQKLINLIPPHRVYIETHLGGGAVLRNKAPADVNIGIDKDADVIRMFVGNFDARFRFLIAAAEEFLAGYHFVGDEFVYADPPYWPRARRSRRRTYRYDYTEEQHVHLLRALRKLPCAVMISGYGNATYDEMLFGWPKQEFTGTSHVGKREETVWLNFQPSLVHDTRFLGETFHERQSIKRKRARWLSRFRGEPVNVQQALLADLSRAFVGPSGRVVE